MFANTVFERKKDSWCDCFYVKIIKFGHFPQGSCINLSIQNATQHHLKCAPTPYPRPQQETLSVSRKNAHFLHTISSSSCGVKCQRITTQTGGARKQTELNAVQHLLIPLNASDKSKCCSKTPVALTVAAPVVSHHSFKTALAALEWQWVMFILWCIMYV